MWENWEKFNGYTPTPTLSDGYQSTEYLVPQVVMPAVTGAPESTLFDYFGVPTGIASLSVNALPFRAYVKIWNDWFRDENLQDEITYSIGDGPDTYDGTVLLRNKRYDYFTSCLPWPQKNVDQRIPFIFASDAPVVEANPAVTPTWSTNNVEAIGQISGPLGNVGDIRLAAAPAFDGAPLFWANTNLEVDLAANAVAGTINELREAFQMQKLFERDARGGTRYVELVKAHFGVTSPDFRLQRSEYIGGGSTPILVNPVAQTTSTAAPTNKSGLGVIGAYGVAAVNNHGFTYSATEHMTIIGLVSVRADLNYQQGLERMWSRDTRYSYYWPALSHLGEQAVLNKEIYAQGTGDDDDVFGYQERYGEYRYKPSNITGLFRSNATGSLDSWHLAQDFGTLPLLNGVFIQENAPMSRIEQVPTEPDFLFDGFFSYVCARPMPTYAVPGLVDHF